MATGSSERRRTLLPAARTLDGLAPLLPVPRITPRQSLIRSQPRAHGKPGYAPATANAEGPPRRQQQRRSIR